MQRLFFSILFLFLFSTSFVFAQNPNMFLDNDIMLLYEKSLLSNPHNSFKPLIKSKGFINQDSVLQANFRYDYNNYYQRKLFSEYLFEVEKEEFQFFISPLFSFMKGKEVDENKTTFLNTRGFIIGASIGEKISFESSFLENQGSFPNYLDSYINSNNIIPGQGRIRNFKDGFDYAMSSGYISYDIFSNLTIQFGHGKHFIGDGYRSLLLSDLSFNYPFLRIQTTLGRFQYTNLYAEFQDIRSPLSYPIGFAKKYMSSHYLSIQVTKSLSIGLYEAIIWRPDHAPGNNGFDINYLNPIVFLRPVEYSLNSPDNALMGLNIKYIMSQKTYLYGQFILDEFSLSEMRKYDNWWGEKYGFQFGLKTYDVFSIENLVIQSEYNLVRPYTYAHSDPLQNYGHYNQPLAHPLGANFTESLLIIYYRWNNIVSRFQFMHAKYGDKIKGDPISYGNDIYFSTSDRPSDSDIEMYQGSPNELNYLQFNLGYIINPKTNLKFDIGFVNRELIKESSIQNTNYYYFGLSTDLFNHYYDF